MKYRRSLAYAVAALLVLSGAASATPVVDGNFDTTEWNGFYIDGDGILGPGVGGQDYDVEYLGYYINSGTETVTFGLQTGHNLGTDPDNFLDFAAGDFAIDLGDNGTWDLGIDFDINTSDNTVTFDLYNIPTNPDDPNDTTYGWKDVEYTVDPNDHSIANPWAIDKSIVKDDNLLATFEGAFGKTSDNQSYVIEGSFNLGDIEGLTLADFAAPSVLHWTMECGNDFLNSAPTVPVPEPTTTFLVAFGAIAGAARLRYRRNSRR